MEHIHELTEADLAGVAGGTYEIDAPEAEQPVRLFDPNSPKVQRAGAIEIAP